MANQTLPEGTDSIVTDSGAGTATSDPTRPAIGTGGDWAEGTRTQAAREKINAKASELKGQATDKARAYAIQGKEQATSTLDGVSKLVEDAATQIDDKVGAQYGDYARQAAQAIAGFSDTLRDKDVDELFEQAREAVRKSPAIAIGAAAALGFVVARIIKAGADSAQATADTMAGRSADGGVSGGGVGSAGDIDVNR